MTVLGIRRSMSDGKLEGDKWDESRETVVIR